MKLIFTLFTLFTVTLTVPTNLESRQLLGFDTANDFVKHGCKGVIMVYARASTEPGNIGISAGPIMQNGLNKEFKGDFAMQGVDYPADLLSNFLPGGTLNSAEDKMAKLLTDAATKCPTAKLAAGGYSQGTAVTAGAIEKLSESVRQRIGAVVVFGYTRNLQNKGKIPNFPSEKTKVYCAIGDLVCSGTLTITLSHFTYFDDASKAVKFISDKLRAIPTPGVGNETVEAI